MNPTPSKLNSKNSSEKKTSISIPKSPSSPKSKMPPPLQYDRLKTNHILTSRDFIPFYISQFPIQISFLFQNLSLLSPDQHKKIGSFNIWSQSIFQFMSKNQQNTNPQSSSSEQIHTSLTSGISPLFANKQSHLSASHEHLLMYEQKNIEIQQMTRITSIPKSLIEAQIKSTFLPSSLKGQQIFQKYGSMIEDQPEFLKEIIFRNYLPYLPEKFQNEFSEILLMGTGFEFFWWSSLIFGVVQGFRHRNADYSLKEKGGKFLAYSFFLLASSFGFYGHYYNPKLKKCFYKNIKTIDTMMDKHINILESCGVKFEQTVPGKPDQTLDSSLPKTQPQKVFEKAIENQAKAESTQAQKPKK